MKLFYVWSLCRVPQYFGTVFWSRLFRRAQSNTTTRRNCYGPRCSGTLVDRQDYVWKCGLHILPTLTFWIFSAVILFIGAKFKLTKTKAIKQDKKQKLSFLRVGFICRSSKPRSSVIWQLIGTTDIWNENYCPVMCFDSHLFWRTGTWFW